MERSFYACANIYVMCMCVMCTCVMCMCLNVMRVSVCECEKETVFACFYSCGPRLKQGYIVSWKIFG